MSIALRQTATAGSHTLVTTTVTSPSINVPSGDLLVVQIRQESTSFGAHVVSIGDNVPGGPNMYIPILPAALADKPGTQMYYVPNVTGLSTFQVTAVLSAAQVNFEIFVWDVSGAALYTPLNSFSSFSHNSSDGLNQAFALPFSTTQANTILLVGVCTDSEGNVYTLSSGLSSDGNFAGLTDSIAAHQVVSALQIGITPGASWTNTGVTNKSMIAAAFNAAFTISGSVGGAIAAGSVVTYTGPASGSVTVDGSGNYTIPGLSNGTYLLTPLNPPQGFVFSPANATVIVSDANATANFTLTTATLFLPFTANPVFDPPSLYGTTIVPQTYSPNRYYFAGTGSLARCRHLQIKVDLGQTPNGDEVYNLTIFGRLMVEL